MKKLTAVILALAILASLGAPALAARDTSFFTPSEHTELSFSDLSYEPVDVEAAMALFDRIREKSDSARNAADVERMLGTAIKVKTMANDMAALTYVYMCQDPASEAADQYVEASTISMRVSDALYVLISDLLDSPCADALKAYFTDWELTAFADYGGLDEEAMELNEKISEKKNEFWTSENDAETEEELYARRAGIYIDLFRLNREAARLAGWDDYAEYAYYSAFARDYSPEEAQSFSDSVKKYIVPVFTALRDRLRTGEAYDFYFEDYSGDRALDEIEPYIDLLSDELAESLEYMRTHGFYDSAYDEKKSNQGFTIPFPGLNAPFFFDSPYESFDDLFTAVHELGHYNNDYWCLDTRGVWSKSIDICEVHSQALELLFTEYCPALLGGEAEGLSAKEYVVLQKLALIIDGTMVDEFERWCYSQEELSAETMAEKAEEIIDEFGLTGESDPDFWLVTPHIYENPFYYISYAVSAAGAFSFWLDAQSDYFRGVDDYLRFTALPTDMGFNESFAAVGVESPMSEKYLSSLADAVSYEMRQRGWYYDDVNSSDWYFHAVDAICAATEGEETGLFMPYEALTAEFAGEYLEGVKTLDRIGIVSALYEKYGEGELAAETPFEDISALSESEINAVNWAYQRGITKGTSEKTFEPEAPCSRAMLVTMLYRAQEAANG